MTRDPEISDSSTGTWTFVGCLGTIALVWLVILPSISNRPGMAAHLQQLDDAGIDPSAMFYTELEMMEPLLKRLEAVPRR